ncbi:insulinase family protein [Tabrizicola piscis]|uniref:Insulinase family protein n=1 Tax=Tabrizicola piscis TaxID=2494374 RepID=A0A3S8U5S2_9RHOB|nr:pitrilysin family protein [Tabrizicola piscis]AZL59032.1 insulinase family protein [Tabrizicola piscis]
MIRAVFAAFLALTLPAYAEIQIKEVVSPGGITAWLVEDHNIPFTALEIQFRGGTSLDAPEKRGAVNLMTALLEEGAADLDSRAFAEARDALAADFTFDSGTDSVGVSVRFLTENRDEAVTLLRKALVEPRFDQDAIDRVREQVLSNLRSNEKDPDTLAANAFDALAFGSHPYGSTGDGTIDTVTKLTRDDILAAHQGALARDRIYVSAAGDITAEELGPLLDTLLGDLPATGTPLPPKADLLLPPGQTVIDFPTPQASVLFGHVGIPRDDPDFFAAFILNEAFGGGRFTARLMSEVREKRGLTYGIGSYLVGMDQAELFMGQFSASNDKVAEAIAVVQAEWARIATEGLTEQELADTKTYLTGSYPLRFDGNGRIANILVGMQMDDMPIDYAATRNAKIEAVTMDDIKRVAQRIFLPEALHFVIVGQPTGL